ncbi:MAG: integrin alpha [Myxococcota bacterium]
MLRGWGFVVVVALGLACSPQPRKVASVEPPIAPNAPQGPTAVDESPPLLTIPQAEVEAASWVEAPEAMTVGVGELLRLDRRPSVGKDISIVETPFGWIASHPERGVVGPVVAPPGAHWLGFDDKGMVAAAKGVLWRNVDWRREDGWQRVGPLPASDLIDAEHGAIVVSDQKTLFVSSDAGRVFTRKPTPARRIDTVLARRDGVVVLQGIDAAGHASTWISTPAGPGWSTADVGPLERFGGLIGDTRQSALAANGRDWLEYCWPSDDARDWLYASDEVNADPPIAMPTFASLKPPTASRACGAGSGGGGMGYGVTGEPIRGSSGEPPPATRHAAALLSDGVCEPDDSGGCNDAKPRLRPPHVLVADGKGRTARVVAVPDDCEPERLFSAVGVATLLCARGDATKLYTLARGPWRDEGELAAPWFAIDSMTAAPDGTLLLHGTCAASTPCDPSFVRNPSHELGDASAWREVTEPDGLAFRVLDGGRALGIRGSRTEGYELTVHGAGKPERIAGVHEPEHALQSLEIDWPARTVSVALVGSRAEHKSDMIAPSRVVSRYRVLADGALAPANRKAGASPEPGKLISERGTEHVAVLNDLNGDGIAEIAMSARLAGVPRVDIVFGGADVAKHELSRAVEAGRGLSITFDEGGYPWLVSIASAGDVNGDGLGDVVAVVDESQSRDPVVGYVVYGRKTVGAVSTTSLRTGDGGFVIRGGPGGRAGPATGVGDLDGDGLDDFALGLPFADDSRGRVYVVYGKRETEWVHLRDVERGAAGFVVRSDHADARLGHVVTGAGDLNADGHSDVLVGAPGHDRDRGRVYVVFGGTRAGAPPRAIESLVASRAALAIDGIAAGDRFGAGIAAKMNLDGDDVGDVAIAAPDADDRDTDAGRVFVVHGAHLEPGFALASAVRGTAGFVVDGEFLGDEIGARLGSVRREDGLDRVVVASREAVRFGRRRGAVYVVDSPPRLTEVARDPVFRDAAFVGGADDVTGDGEPDFVVGYVEGARDSAAVVIRDSRSP